MVFVPVAEGVWRTNDDGATHLIGSRCRACGTTSFPVSTGCAKCTADELDNVDLPTEGTLWSWTIQGFLPKNPPYAGRESAKDFVPYGVGYVDLGPCIVEARLTENRAEALQIGMPLRLVIIPFMTREDGTEVTTFAFEPTGDPS